jgi:hypothetical protein
MREEVSHEGGGIASDFEEMEDRQHSAEDAPHSLGFRPYIGVINGEKRLCIDYLVMVKKNISGGIQGGEWEEQEDEWKIERFFLKCDLENVDTSELSGEFKARNCIYPGANVPHEMYMGDRWEYETECNRLAWQFVFLNPVLLYRKKGLIQRAVDSYRGLNSQRALQERNKRTNTTAHRL